MLQDSELRKFVKDISNDDMIKILNELYYRRTHDGKIKPNWICKKKYEESETKYFMDFEQEIFHLLFPN